MHYDVAALIGRIRDAASLPTDELARRAAVAELCRLGARLPAAHRGAIWDLLDALTAARPTTLGHDVEDSEPALFPLQALAVREAVGAAALEVADERARDDAGTPLREG